MGMALTTDPTTPIPRRVTLWVSCDGEHGFLPTVATFDATEGNPRAPAIRSGWRITQDGVVLCPRCARKP